MRGFIGTGCRGGGQEGEGNGENCSATCLTVSGFMVVGFLSGLSLANHSELGSSWGHVRHLVEMDSSKEDPGRLVGPLDWSFPSPSDLSRILAGGSLLVPCSLPGPPVVR